MKDDKFIRIAIKEAIKGKKTGEVPVGAVVVSEDGCIIAKAHNQCIKKSDPSAHAEIEALRKAGKRIGNYRLPGCSIYITVEPCIMCTGAIINARIKRVVFGTRSTEGNGGRLLLKYSKRYGLNHKVEVMEGILENECSEILKNFFEEKRR